MRYRNMGRTGLKVSEICLGTLTFGDQATIEESEKILNAAWEAGVNFFDTADVYVSGRSEEVLGKLLVGRRHEAVIATKVHGRTGPGPNDVGNSRVHILKGVEDSLRRLQTDYIDLYQTHRPDYGTPLEETLRAFDDLVRQGKVRYIGCSFHPAWYLCKSLWISDVRRLVRYDCIQSRYNILDRNIEQEVLPLCKAEGIGVICYNPIGGGFLTGKYKQTDAPPENTRFALRKDYGPRYWHQTNFDAVDRFGQIARDYGRTPAQLAIAWVLGNPTVTAPIVGASKLSQIEENLKAADQPLSDEERKLCAELEGVMVDPELAPRM